MPANLGLCSIEMRYHSGRPTDPRHHRENLTCLLTSTSTKSASGSALASLRVQAGRSPHGSSGGSSLISERKRQMGCILFVNLSRRRHILLSLQLAAFVGRQALAFRKGIIRWHEFCPLRD